MRDRETDPGRDGMMYAPDMSRRARAVELWVALRYLGRSGVEDLVDGFCARADRERDGVIATPVAGDGEIRVC